VARELFTLLFCATIAFLLGNGYYKSFGSGVLTIRGRSYRRDTEPIRYWIGMAIGTVAFFVVVFASAVMAFLVCLRFSGTPR